MLPSNSLVLSASGWLSPSGKTNRPNHANTRVKNQRGTRTAADMGMPGTELNQTLFSKTQAADSRKTPQRRYLNFLLFASHGLLFAFLRMNIDYVLRSRYVGTGRHHGSSNKSTHRSVGGRSLSTRSLQLHLHEPASRVPFQPCDLCYPLL